MKPLGSGKHDHGFAYPIGPGKPLTPGNSHDASTCREQAFARRHVGRRACAGTGPILHSGWGWGTWFGYQRLGAPSLRKRVKQDSCTLTPVAHRPFQGPKLPQSLQKGSILFRCCLCRIPSLEFCLLAGPFEGVWVIIGAEPSLEVGTAAKV